MIKTKFIFSTEKRDHEEWMDIPIVPRINEWIDVQSFFNSRVETLEHIKCAAICWSGIRGIVQSVEYKYLENGCFPEIVVWCED
jgi:hypothetical protein